MTIKERSIPSVLRKQLSVLTQAAPRINSPYKLEWRGRSGKQVVEVRVFASDKAIELEGELELLAPLALALRSLIEKPASVVLIDEGNAATISLTERTSIAKIIASWSA